MLSDSIPGRKDSIVSSKEGAAGGKEGGGEWGGAAGIRSAVSDRLERWTAALARYRRRHHKATMAILY